MKNIFAKLLVTIIPAVISIAAACSKGEEIYIPDGEYESSRIYLNLTLPDGEMKASAISENMISDLNAAVYNGAGRLVANIYMRSGEDFRITVSKGERYRVYVTANAGKEIINLKEEDMKKYTHSVSSPDAMSGTPGGVLMTGVSERVELYDGCKVDVTLKRAVAKVTVRGDFTALNPDVRLTVRNIAIRNIPKEIRLFRTNKPEDASGIFADGYSCGLSGIGEFSTGGTVFYMLENMQGTLQPGNTDQRLKVLDESCPCYKVCSYLEIDADYSSPDHSGTLKYRFYLGRDMTTNYDVERNTTQNITVYFSGNGSVGETTWRVDVDGLSTLVKRVVISPSSLDFQALGEDKQLSVTLQPSDATEKRVIWSSSDPNVARVDSDGKVTSVSYGDCTITATSADPGGASATVPVRVAGGSVAFPSGQRVMYEGEIAAVGWKLLDPATAVPQVTSDNPSVLAVKEVSSSGVTVQALARGTARLTARLGSSTSSYSVAVEPLSIVFTDGSPLCVNVGFDKTVGYRITPESAEGLELEWSGGDETASGMVSPPFFIFPQGNSRNVIRGVRQPDGAGSTVPLTARFRDFPDKQFTTAVKIIPALVPAEDEGEINILVNAFVTRLCNLKHSDVELEHTVRVQSAPGAAIRWTSSNPSVLLVDASGKVYTQRRSSAKGDMSVTASVTGDDGNTYSETFPVKIWEEVNLLGVTSVEILYEDDYGYPIIHMVQSIELFEPETGPNPKPWRNVATAFREMDEVQVGAIGDQEQFYYTELGLSTHFDSGDNSTGVKYRYIISKKYWTD